MADVQFQNEPQFTRPSFVSAPTGIMGLVIRMGWAKDATSAQYVLAGITAAAIILAIGIYMFSSRQTPAALPSGAVIINQPGQPPRLAQPLTGS